MGKLTLNDGTELMGTLTEVNGNLLLTIMGKTLAEVFALLNDPEKTKVITAEEYGQTITVTGYNHLKSVSESMGGMINAGLIRE